MNEDELRMKFFAIKNQEHIDKKGSQNIDASSELIPITPINYNQKQAFLYTRVSTMNQKNDGFSLEVQNAQLRKYCEDRNFQVLHLFEDGGLSGGEMKNRPQLLLMLSSLKPGYYVVCASLSRLSRNMEQLLHIVKLIQDAKAELILLDLNIDTSTPVGRMSLLVMGSISEFERNQTRERVGNVMAHLRSENRLICKPMYGWTRKKGGELERKEDEQLVIEMIKLIVKNNPDISINRITSTLNKKGFTNRNKKSFHATTILSIVQNNDIPVKFVKHKVDTISQIQSSELENSCVNNVTNIPAEIENFPTQPTPSNSMFQTSLHQPYNQFQAPYPSQFNFNQSYYPYQQNMQYQQQYPNQYYNYPVQNMNQQYNYIDQNTQIKPDSNINNV